MRLSFLSVIGPLLALLLWWATAVSFGPPEIRPIPNDNGLQMIVVPFDHQPWQSSIIRISPFSCNDHLAVNGRLRKPNQALERMGPDERKICDHDPATVDLAPYLVPGHNVLRITYRNRTGDFSHIARSLHSTPQMLLITACLLLAPLTSGIARLWRARTALRCRHLPLLLAGTIAIALGIYLRTRLIPFLSFDYKSFVSWWLDHIRGRGLDTAYRDNFSNYAPLYTYVLGLFDLFFPTLPTLYSVKGTTFAGELFAAFWMYRLLALRWQNPVMPMLGALALLLCPSVLINGAVTGQCDIWWTSFVLAALYYIVTNRALSALLCAGIAFSFKQQALFLSPLLLALFIRKKLPWKWCWLPIAVYIATCVPAWLEGRGLQDLLSVYRNQIGGGLNYNATNLYLFSFFLNHERLGTMLGLAFALSFATITSLRWKQPETLTQYVLLASLTAGMMPYVLPYMHDRYFFAAEILTLLLAFLTPRWWLPTVLLQASSLLAPRDDQTPLTIFANHDTGLWLGMYMNGIALCILFYLCIKHVWKKS